MSQHRVCPWWLGYLLANPIRRLWHDPREILRPHVREGMTVLEPGPGMGFFTLELLRLTGPSGRVVAVEIQPRMLAALKRRAAKAGLLDRLDARLAQPDSMGLAGLDGTVDFVLAFAVVHELPAACLFFAEVSRVLKSRARLLLAEPSGHVKPDEFEEELRHAASAGLEPVDRPPIRHSSTALLEKTS
jgi:ubiquinone/menaquinone biosynthesis C-methylase UbiE